VKLDVLVERHLLATMTPPPPALAVARLVHDDAEDPGAQGGLAAEAVDGAKDAEKDLLGDFERFFAVSDEVERELEDHALVLAHEIGARQLIAGGTPLDERRLPAR
jgi:hypothetical protein